MAAVAAAPQGNVTARRTITETAPAELLEIGVLTRPQGVQGQLRLRLHNPDSTVLAAADRPQVWIQAAQGQPRSVQLRVVRATGAGLVVELEGVAHRDAAEALRGSRVLVARSELSPCDEGQYLYADLVGCEVVDQGGQPVGRVHSLFEAGASDVLVVRQGETERYIPLVEPWVEAVDLEARQIRVADVEQWDSWPAGTR